MGARYLTDLADVCRSTGWPVIEVDDWQNRARGSGGYEPGYPNHVIIHHTASGPSSDGWPDVNYCTYGHDDSPIGNLYLARDGTVYVMAGGAANTNGSGSDPCGLMPDDGANSRSIAIEAGNGGTGEPWAEAQQSSYVALVAALCAAYRIGVEQCHSHAEWTTRKVDPAGPSRWAEGSATWNLDAFRCDVDAASTPEPEPEPEDPDMPLTFIAAAPGAATVLVAIDGAGVSVLAFASGEDQTAIIAAVGNPPTIHVTAPQMTEIMGRAGMGETS